MLNEMDIISIDFCSDGCCNGVVTREETLWTRGLWKKRFSVIWNEKFC